MTGDTINSLIGFLDQANQSLAQEAVAAIAELVFDGKSIYLVPCAYEN